MINYVTQYNKSIKNIDILKQVVGTVCSEEFFLTEFVFILI